MDGSSEQPQMTAGLDLGDKYSYQCLIDTESAEVVEEGRLRTTPEALRRRFASLEPSLRIAIETRAHPGGSFSLCEEPLRRSIPGAGARHRPVGRQGSPEAHFQGRRRDAAEAPGR
jgi:hypothetical protein